VNRRGAKQLGLFHRLGITLVILGMIQSLAPTNFRPTRSSLRLPTRLRVALAPLGDSESSVLMLVADPTLPSPTEPNQESDQESHDTEDLAETLAWPPAMTDRRAIQGVRVSDGVGSLAKPASRVDAMRFALQRSRSLSILAADSSLLTSRLCRFTC